MKRLSNGIGHLEAAIKSACATSRRRGDVDLDRIRSLQNSLDFGAVPD